MKKLFSLKQFPFVFMFLLIVLIATALAVYMLLFRQETKDNSNYAKAEELYQERDHSEAVSYYKRAINDDPMLTDAYVKAAEILLIKGQSDEAIAVLEKGIGFAADEAKIYEKLAFAYAQKGDFAKALENANTSLEKDPGNPQSKRDKVAYLYLTGKNEEADKAAQDLNPGDNEYLNFVKSILSFKDLEKSLEYADKSDSQALKETLKTAQTKPDETIANYMDIAFVAVQKDESALVIPIINEIKASNNYYEGAYIYEGYLYIQYKDYDKAISSLKVALSYTPNNYEIYKLLAVAYYEKGDYAEAEKHINKALALNKTNDILYVAYRTSWALESHDKSVEYTSLMYLSEDKSFDFTLDYLNSLVLKGDYAKVIEISDKELENTEFKDEEKSILNSFKAWAQTKLNKKTEALETFDEAEKLEPTNAYFKYYKALYFENTNDGQKAQEYLKQAVNSDLKGDISVLASSKLPKEEK